MRIVRDTATGIGKGFGYVNFATEDSVEIALTLNGSELDGRKIRVSRFVLNNLFSESILVLRVYSNAISDASGRQSRLWDGRMQVQVGQTQI